MDCARKLKSYTRPWTDRCPIGGREHLRHLSWRRLKTHVERRPVEDPGVMSHALTAGLSRRIAAADILCMTSARRESSPAVLAGAEKASPSLTVTYEKFSEHELRAWRNKHYSLVDHCFPPLKGILCRKAEARPGRRFFGEAYVAASIRHDQCWYGSFKWLTSPKWSGLESLSNSYQNQFRSTLLHHFPRLSEFQELVRAFTPVFGRQRPVGPDLWLPTRSNHRFIEVKLPGDRISQHQLVGLALIAMLLRGDRPVSVEVFNLHSDGKVPASRQLKEEFASICARLREARRHRPHGERRKL
jgi:hypothetical protein